MKESFSCQRGTLTIRGHVYREKEGVLPPVILCHGFRRKYDREAVGVLRMFMARD